MKIERIKTGVWLIDGCEYEAKTRIAAIATHVDQLTTQQQRLRKALDRRTSELTELANRVSVDSPDAWETAMRRWYDEKGCAAICSALDLHTDKPVVVRRIKTWLQKRGHNVRLHR